MFMDMSSTSPQLAGFESLFCRGGGLLKEDPPVTKGLRKDL